MTNVTTRRSDPRIIDVDQQHRQPPPADGWRSFRARGAGGRENVSYGCCKCVEIEAEVCRGVDVTTRWTVSEVWVNYESGGEEFEFLRRSLAPRLLV